jgi:protoporphyrinogen oxidase
VTVGLLLDRLEIQEPGVPWPGVADNWIYIQEPDVKVGRLQVFNNWSPYLVADPETVWVGLEYFVNESEDLGRMTDAEMIALGIAELSKLGIIRAQDVRDATVLRVPKTYPAYFGTYTEFDTLRRWIDGFENLFLMGRNGMHRYNNQDHSMLTAMVTVENIAAGITSKDNIWSVNVEQDYHEEKSREPVPEVGIDLRIVRESV